MLNDIPIHWQANPGPQTEVLRRQEDELLYGGSRGGGKTDAGMAWMIEPDYINNPLYSGLVIRRNADDLSDWIARARRMYSPLNAVFAGNPPRITFPSGAFIRTGHLKDENAYTKYQGHEYQKMLVEELTQIPSEMSYLQLISSCRSTVPGLKAQVMATANPGGKGHQWVKQRFVDVARNKTYYERIPVNGREMVRTRIFIPARVEDTPQLIENDPTYVALLESLPGDLRRAWREGDWDIFAGQFFSMWRHSIHVVENPFAIPSGWRRYCGIDYGTTNPFCCLWGAVDYDDNLWIYREVYQAGLNATGQARAIKDMGGREDIYAYIADPSMWAKNQAQGNLMRSISDFYADEGLVLVPANNDRVNGWNALREYLDWAPERKPRMFIFETCRNLIRTLPSLVHDEHKVEDVDSDGEDHAADALRYMTMYVYKPKRPAGMEYTDFGFNDHQMMDRRQPQGPAQKGARFV